MAEVAETPNGKANGDTVHDLQSLLFAEDRDFLVRNNGDQAMEAKIEEMAKGWPEKVKHDLHTQHELKLKRRRVYNCDGCGVEGHAWSYYCEECDFDLHPKCALEEEKKEDDEKGENKEGDSHEGAAKEGWVCDGDVCQKA